MCVLYRGSWIFVSAVIVSLSVRAAEPVMRSHHIDVGQGAATLLEFPCGAVLIDTGAQDDQHVEHLAEYLRQFFIERPDLNNTLSVLVISHPHADHTKGLRRVAQVCRIANYVDNGFIGRASGQRDVKWVRDQIEAGHMNTHVREVSDDEITSLPHRNGLTDQFIDPIRCEDCDPELRVLSGQLSVNPGWGSSQFKNQNNHSVAMRVDFGESSFLFLGDMEEKAQQTFVNYYRGTDVLDVDVYQVAHHGSHNGTTEALLEAMSPSIAVIGVGRWDFGAEDPFRVNGGFNTRKFGHPRRIVLDLLTEFVPGNRSQPLAAMAFERASPGERLPIPLSYVVRKRIYATSWDGDVTIRADLAGGMRVETHPSSSVPPPGPRALARAVPALAGDVESVPYDSVTAEPGSPERQQARNKTPFIRPKGQMESRQAAPIDQTPSTSARVPCPRYTCGPLPCRGRRIIWIRRCRYPLVPFGFLQAGQSLLAVRTAVGHGRSPPSDDEYFTSP